MVGDYLQQQIIKGNAEHIIKNVCDVTFNWEVGRNQNVIIEKIQIQPLVVETFANWKDNDTIEEIQSVLEEILGENICTLRVYDGKTTKNYTFKLNLRITAIRAIANPGGTVVGIIFATSEPIEIDVFWKFTGEQITFELFSAEDLFSDSAPTFSTDTQAIKNKAENPKGSNAPYLISRQDIVSGFYLANLGQKSESPPAFPLRNTEAIVPAIGDDQTGNKFPVKATGSNFFDQSYPIISVGAVLYKPEKLNC